MMGAVRTILFLWSEQIFVLWVWHEVRQDCAGHLSSSFWVFLERPALSHCPLLLWKLPLRLPHRTVPVHGCSASLWCHHLCIGEEGGGRGGWQSNNDGNFWADSWKEEVERRSCLDRSTAGLTSAVSRSCKVTKDYRCEFSHDGTCVVRAQGSKWNR